ncbi:MAG TPA: tRNA epoxyqueuosine(34) reductase QueG [Gemmatimonadales bacterium]|nr:tRNA epoxyqueuosine(34) reductase QueG [Gemmatimonadales bacterium]
MTPVAAIKARAAELGFIACGIADLSPMAGGARLERWLAAGYGGTMRYLHRQAKKRKDPARIASQGRSFVVVLDNYYYESEDCGAPRIARYARGRDYHLATVERLEQLAESIRGLGAGYTRTFADAGPVPERELAQRAGLGWVGKNTMLIRPGVGSWFFIGSVLTDLLLPPDAAFQTDHCGQCTRCLDACPTAAFVEPGMLDATRCISYLTIEQPGPIPGEFRSRLEGWGFGCDICNEVCPWNQRFARDSGVPDFRPRADSPAGTPAAFERMTPEEFEARFADTPLERPGLEKLRDNWKAAAESHKS